MSRAPMSKHNEVTSALRSCETSTNFSVCKEVACETISHGKMSEESLLISQGESNIGECEKMIFVFDLLRKFSFESNLSDFIEFSFNW